jgi:hypothetical protein
MAQIDKFTIGLSFDVNQFKSSATQVQTAVNDLSTSIGKTFTYALEGIGTYFTTEFAAKLINGFATTGMHLQNLSAIMHENVATVNLWEETYKRFGGTSAQFDSSAKAMYDRLQKATQQGDPVLAGMLNQLKISPDVALNNFSQYLTELGDKLRAKGKDGYRIALNMGIDPTMFRMLTDPNIQARQEHIKSLGLWSESDVSRASMINSKIADMSQQWDNLGRTILFSVSPAIESASNAAMLFVNTLTHNLPVVKDLMIGLAGAFAVMAAMNPFVQTLAAITAVIAGITYISDKLQSISSGTSSLVGLDQRTKTAAEFNKLSPLQKTELHLLHGYEDIFGVKPSKYHKEAATSMSGINPDTLGIGGIMSKSMIDTDKFNKNLEDKYPILRSPKIMPTLQGADVPPIEINASVRPYSPVNNPHILQQTHNMATNTTNINNNNNSHQYHIASLNMHNMTNSMDFHDVVNDKSITAMAFSSGLVT